MRRSQNPRLSPPMCMARAAAMIIMITTGMITRDMTTTHTTITRATTTPPMDTNILMIDAARLQRPSHDPSQASAGSALPLLIWLSPAFPVGAFAYSHGLEAAVEAGDIANAATLQAWLDDLVRYGSLRTDALLAACAWRAAVAGDLAAIIEINDLTLALAPSKERHLETTGQGNAFVTAVQASWPSDLMGQLAQGAEPIAYPVAVAVAAAAHGVPLPALLDAFLVAFAGNLVSAAVRLGPVGQTDGQRIIARLVPALREAAQMAASGTLDDLGSAALRSDIAAMRHETQYSRLFRS